MPMCCLWSSVCFIEFIVSSTLLAEPFLTRRERKHYRNRVTSLLSMRKPLLGNSFKASPSLDRTPSRHVEFPTEGSILTFALSKKRCARSLNRFDRSDLPRNLGCGDFKTLDKFSAEPLFLAFCRVLERLCSQGMSQQVRPRS